MLRNGFLFRRLASLMPCVLSGVAEGKLILSNKWLVASLRDVFLSAHYWRLYDHLDSEPKVVVDFGAHCGHFIALMHLIITERFGRDMATYVAVEANPMLMPLIRQTVADLNLQSQTTIFHGALGRREGTINLQINSHNLLAASVTSNRSGARHVTVPYLDPRTLLEQRSIIDVLKIDIEGSEYELWHHCPEVFRAAKHIVMELHGSVQSVETLLNDLIKLGFTRQSQDIVRNGMSMVLLRNSQSHPLSPI
jgi:FkbM family methyltransferase